VRGPKLEPLSALSYFALCFLADNSLFDLDAKGFIDIDAAVDRRCFKIGLKSRGDRKFNAAVSALKLHAAVAWFQQSCLDTTICSVNLRRSDNVSQLDGSVRAVDKDLRGHIRNLDRAVGR